MDGKNLNIIVPIAQKIGFLKLFMESLIKTVDCECNLFLVNDCSEQKSKKYLENISKQEIKNFKIKLINHETPRGSVSSIVEAMKISPEGDFIFLDSDIILEQNWIEEFKNIFKTYKDAGVATGTLIYPQSMGINYAGITFSEDIGKHLYLNMKYQNLPQKPYKVQSAIFAFFYIKYEVFQKIGYPDENFFNGYEDFDYSLRVIQSGFSIYVNPLAKAYHWERSSGIHRSNNRKRNLARF